MFGRDSEQVPRPPLHSASAMARELADLVARRISVGDFAERMGLFTHEVQELEAEIVNAVMLRRMSSVDGTRTAHVPTSGLDVFARSETSTCGTGHIVEIGVTVTNELPVPLKKVSLECASFSNSSASDLSLGGTLEALDPAPEILLPGASIEYRARYVPEIEDYHDDALLICSFLSRGVSGAGELAIGQGDAWIELGADFAERNHR